jgi:hypothetical protein
MQDRGTIVTATMFVTAVVLAGAWGFYFASIITGKSSSTFIGATGQDHASGSSKVYHVELVEVMNTGWNRTVAQPKFFVLGSKGLESSANIQLPAKTLIELTIISYDTPTPNATVSMASVAGTVGGKVYVINATTASVDDPSLQWSVNASSVPLHSLAHTFSIPTLGINVPVPAGSLVNAYLYFNETGTFQWLCETPCGFGPAGAGGAMAQPGWMQGQVTVT